MENRKIPNEALDIIYQNSSEYIKVEEVKELIKYVNRLRHMSIDNAILVRVQKPDCKYAQESRYWKFIDNKKIKPEAKPLIILRWNRAEFVYALSDTNARKYELDWVPPECEEEIIDDYFKNIIFNMKTKGIDFKRKILESKIAGHIKVVDEDMVIELTCNEKEYLVKTTHIIEVSDTLSDREIIATLIHELGHYFCGHIYRKEKLNPLRKFSRKEHLTHEQEEFEAECVNHIVCSRKSITSDTKECLWTYLDENKEISKSSINRILEAARRIELMLKSKDNPTKGYVKYDRNKGENI